MLAAVGIANDKPFVEQIWAKIERIQKITVSSLLRRFMRPARTFSLQVVFIFRGQRVRLHILDENNTSSFRSPLQYGKHPMSNRQGVIDSIL